MAEARLDELPPRLVAHLVEFVENHLSVFGKLRIEDAANVLNHHGAGVALANEAQCLWE